MTLVPDTLVFVTRKGFLFASFFGFGLQSTDEAEAQKLLGFFCLEQRRRDENNLVEFFSITSILC